MASRILGWSILVLVSLLPVFLLFYLGPNEPALWSYGIITHKLGQIAALVGMTLFALTFVLSTRIKIIEDMFGGLDKVYIVHSVTGGMALALLVFHPILLVLKFIPEDFYLAAIYLIPSAFWSVNFGIIAILGLFGLLFFTFYTRIRYNTWKFSHKFLGLVFAFAVLHIFLIRNEAARDYIFQGYYVYAAVVSIIGLGAFFYSLFLKDALKKNAIYFIENLNKRKNVFEIVLRPERKPLEYRSGQFVFVRFYNEQLSSEAHPFSIASKSNDSRVKIIIKGLGDYTSNLGKLKVGDKVALEGPYGRFNFQNKNREQVWVAGGIGITPFLGMAEDLRNGSIRRVHLFYQVRSEEDFISLENLKSIEASNKNFKVIPWISEKKGYLTLKEMEKTSGNLLNKDFYLCGPTGMKESLRNGLTERGVSKDRIFEEDFEFK